MDGWSWNDDDITSNVKWLMNDWIVIEWWTNDGLKMVPDCRLSDDWNDIEWWVMIEGYRTSNVEWWMMINDWLWLDWSNRWHRMIEWWSSDEWMITWHRMMMDENQMMTRHGAIKCRMMRHWMRWLNDGCWAMHDDLTSIVERGWVMRCWMMMDEWWVWWLIDWTINDQMIGDDWIDRLIDEQT